MARGPVVKRSEEEDCYLRKKLVLPKETPNKASFVIAEFSPELIGLSFYSGLPPV
jgi:hypothetical protein